MKVATSLPLPMVVIVGPEPGPKVLWVKINDGYGGVQLRHFHRDGTLTVDIIDADGNYHQGAMIRAAGTNHEVYARAGLLGRVAALAGSITRSVLVKYEVVSPGQSRRIDLKQAREILGNAIEGNPDHYTHAPPKTLVGRVRKARDFGSMFKSITKD